MSASRVLGGNRVVTHDGALLRFELAAEPYLFRLEKPAAGARIELPAAAVGVLCVLAGTVGVDGEILATGDVAIVEHGALRAQAVGDGAEVVLSSRGVPGAGVAPQLRVTRSAQVKRVTKPWGHELWLTGEHPVLALKQLHVKQGKRLSLQYHHQKRETLVLVEGRIGFWFKCSPSVANDAVSAADLGQETLAPVTSFDVMPGCLHRMEGIEDATLYEASTPELDDVVRVSDDWNRADGRIDSEHRR